MPEVAQEQQADGRQHENGLGEQYSATVKIGTNDSPDDFMRSRIFVLRPEYRTDNHRKAK